MLDRTTPPPVEIIGNLTLPQPQTEILSNGITLQMIKGGSQDVNQLVLVWDGGTFEARTPMVARFAAQLMFEGADGMSGEEISEAIDFRGAMVRADSTDHYTELSVISLNSFSEGLLPLIKTIIEKPDFPAKALETYKEREVKNLLISMSKVAAMSQIQLLPLIMGKDNPMALPPTVEDIVSVTREELIDFHNKSITSSRCHAYLSGRITDELYQAIKEMLESLGNASEGMCLKRSLYQPEPPQEAYMEKEGALQSSVRIAFPAPVRSHPDYVPLRFATMALGGYFGSRLMKNIREDKGYTYGIRALLLGSLDGSYISIDAQCDNNYINPVLEEIAKELVALAERPVIGDEMQCLRQHISSALVETLDTPFTISDYYKTELLVGMPRSYFEDQMRVARNLTPEVIMEMARKYMNPSQMRISIAGLRHTRH